MQKKHELLWLQQIDGSLDLPASISQVLELLPHLASKPFVITNLFENLIKAVDLH